MKSHLLKRSLLASALTAGLLFSIAPQVANAGVQTATIAVTLTVAPYCSLAVGGGGALDFGTTPSPLTANIDRTTQLTVTCTPSTPYTIALDLGTGGGSYALLTAASGGRLLVGTATPSNQAPYQLYTDSARTQVWGDNTAGSITQGATSDAAGTAVVYTVYGRVPGNTPGTATPMTLAGDMYHSTVTATVSF